MDLEGRNCGIIEILSQHFCGSIKENHENPESRYMGSQLRIKSAPRGQVWTVEGIRLAEFTKMEV
jgi:hypothetical protein